jgi:peptidoglycan/xylan/chitin deacetylase (PgdA/CDA1 family)/negative regulator of sigma E activity
MRHHARLLTRRHIAAAAMCLLGWGLAGAASSPPGLPALAQQNGEDSPLAWLRSAATAPRRVSYAGTKTITVWAGGVQASQVRVYHEAPDNTRLEYLPAGTQPERIVIISGGTAVEFTPGENEFIRRPAPAVSEEGLNRNILPRIVENYDILFGGSEQVAGRPTRIVDVVGKVPGRPRLRIWIDTETRLILRFERYGPAGVLRETSAFLSIEMNPALSADLFTIVPPPGAQVQTRRPGARPTLDQIEARVGFVPQLPAYLPSGYQLVGSRVSIIRRMPTATFAFSDGISTLTLFESRGPQGPPPNGRRVRIGSVEGTVISRGVATLLHWNSGDLSFTLVGDLPQDELVRVGASVPPARSLLPEGTATAGSWIALVGAVPMAEAAHVFAAGAPPAHPRARRPPPAAGWVPPGVPPVPASPYITNNTHPIGPGIRDEEERIWKAYAARGLTPIVVKITVASDGVSLLPDGRIARLAWIWFVYGMDWTGGESQIMREVRESARALSVTAFEADPRVNRVMLTGYYHDGGRFDARRTDATFTARLYRDRLLSEAPGRDAGDALWRAGDVWYGPDLLAGTLVELMPVAHDPHLPLGIRGPGAGLAGDRSVEAVERFQGNPLERLLEVKDRLAGLLFGMESRGRLWRGNPRRREIALTFDDGPSPIATPLLLAILHRYGVQATFFVIGEHARAYPYLVADMAADGHEIADHTFHHPNMATIDPAEAAQEVEAAATVIRETAGRRPLWFRPPGGDYTTGVFRAARDAGMGLAMWTENSGDWALIPAKALMEQVPARAEPGSIILLHNGTLNTVRALPRIIIELRRAGYAFVTVSKLAEDAD